MAVLGSGDVGKALATGFLQLGYQVKIGTRTPTAEKIAGWARTAGPDASVGTFSEAASFGELAVVATRGAATEEALRLAGPSALVGKVVIDVTNPLVFHENAPPTLFIGLTDSLGEQVQRWLPDSHVVKARNITGNAHFFKPNFPGGPPDMFICGNDAAAKARVTKILAEFGWPSIDIGGIEGARLLEPLCILWVHSALRLGSWNVAFKLLRK